MLKKIISLFKRNYETDRLVRNEITPGAEWVLAGEGRATRKYDGTCCMIRNGKLFKRYDAKAFTVNLKTKEKTSWNRLPPEGFEPAQEPDEATGHWPGWVPVGNGPENKYHREVAEQFIGPVLDGTYELCGPKVQGNPEKYAVRILIKHGAMTLQDCPRDYEGLKAYLTANDMEGIVWHHDDGRMVKIKTKDFGLKRK